MTTPLLRTKLYIPPVRPEMVSRPRLMDRLNAGLDRKLTLISAPAGFGKTTLLSGCVARCGRPVGWVSLDEGDNDLVRFWSYFIAALQTIHAGTGESVLAGLETPQPLPVEALLTGLINEITRIQDPPSASRRGEPVEPSGRGFALVLDDFHVITEQQIQDGLRFLVDNLPPQMHLILSSRSDPPWPLARLRARRQMTELRAKDLRFTSEEAAAFLNDAMGLGLSAQDVDALEARTEGWIAGLQMAAISMQGRRQTQGIHGMSSFIRAFTGSHRFVLDYLVEEVLDQQSPTIQEFLLKTSILERLTASLCDAVLEAGSWKLEVGSPISSLQPPTSNLQSQTILEHLESSNLFIVPLDDDRRWYRYHQLFADLLRGRLEQTQPDQVPALHRQASQWYEQNELIAQAASHALVAGDLEQVARLVEGHAFELLDLRELTTLERWLDTLPEELVRSRPWLCIARAWLHVYTGRLDHVEHHLEDAGRALSTVLSPIEGHHATGHITAIRAYIAELQGDMLRAAGLARQALEFLPEDDLKTRAFVAAMLGTVLHIDGDLEAAAQAFSEAVTVSQKAGDSHTAVHALCDLAALQRDKGQLHKAAASCRQALDLADEYTRLGGRRLPGTDYAYARLSEVMLQWNDLDAALRYANEGVELAEQRREADKLWICYTRLAIVLSCTGDFDAGLAALEKARQTRSGESYHVAYTDLYETALRLKQGDMAAASRWVQETGASVDDEISIGLRYKHILLTRILIAQGELEDAHCLLARLLKMAESTGLTGSVIEILILRALALQAQGKVEQALAALERALSLAEPGGYLRVFIDEGAPMGELLRRAMVRGIAPEYVGKLLAAFGFRFPTSAKSKVEIRKSKIIEPLSQRELEVLRLLTTSLSSTEIAEELLIAPSTVRSHIKSIYGKLNVHKRIAAVERARELGLL